MLVVPPSSLDLLAQDMRAGVSSFMAACGVASDTDLLCESATSRYSRHEIYIQLASSSFP